MVLNDLSQYLAIQPLMKTGDLIEWAGNNPISKAIMRVTGKQVSHCSAVVILPKEGEDRRWIIEAISKGVQFNLLSENLSHYHGAAYWYALKNEYDHFRADIGAWLWREYRKEKKYDFKGVMIQLFRRASLDATNWFCSELFDGALCASGIIKPDPAGARRPGDFVSTGIFGAKARIL